MPDDEPPTQRVRTAGHLHLHGGRLCLDFVNTATWDGQRVLREHLLDFEDVVQWGEHCRLGDGDVLRHRIAAECVPDVRLEAELSRLRLFRLRLRRLLSISAASARGRLARIETSFLEAVLRQAIAGARLDGAQVPLSWRSDTELSAGIVAPVAVSAAALLCSGRILNVRTCEGDGCGWMFLDESRSHRRRWCAMVPCGNRLKTRAHQERKRAATSPAKGRSRP